MQAVANPHPGIKKLRFAAHRFDSSQQPLSRCILFFPALLGTLAQIVRVRTSNTAEHKAACAFFNWLDTEKALQAALLADAGEEHLKLMRLLDYEGFPPGDPSYQIGAFVHRIKSLFGVGGGQAEALDFSYAAHMVSILKHPIMLPGAEVRVVGSEGGLPDALLALGSGPNTLVVWV